MTQKQATRKSTKVVQIIARIVFKADSRKVCYLVKSSNSKEQYTTCLFNGKACSCSCASRKPCYHMTGVEAYEAERNAPSTAVHNPSTVATNMVIEAKRRQSASLQRQGFNLMR